MSIEFSHDYRIAGARVAAVDRLLAPAESQQLYQALRRSSYTRTEIARPETAEYRHWATEIELAVCARMPIHAPTLAALSKFAQGKAFRLYRSYVNVAHYGDMLFTHTDCKPGAGEVTALWYLSEHWDPEWGGETLFFDEHMDVRAAISPRPGRLALFDGEIPHVGRPPNRICYAPRYTLAMKFEPAG